MKTTLLTVIALLAFAGNSVLCRMALGDGLIDAEGFTSVRLLAGAITLVILLLIGSNQARKISSLKPTRRQWVGSSMLFVYAFCFSLAYLILDTGSGALILFGFVQLTLLIGGWFFNQKPSVKELSGVLLAFFGLVYWLVPVWGTPSLGGFILMAVSGFAWGVYTLNGRTAKTPLRETTLNFIYCLPLVFLLNLWVFEPTNWTVQGLVLAVISGAVTSGIGYSVWYAVLPKMKATSAGVIQLMVPVIAAFGGWFFVQEAVSQRLLISSVMVLGGVFWVLYSNQTKG